MKNILPDNNQLYQETNTNQHIRQLQFESDTWKRLLGFMSEENVHLKNRLSEVLKDRFNKNLLDDVERFFSKFIVEDEVINLLRNDIAAFDKLLNSNLIHQHHLHHSLEKKIRIIQNNILVAERQFGKLKLDFNKYLSDNT